MRRLSTGLIGYGLVGIAVTLIGVVALVWVSGRIAGLADRTTEQVESIVMSLDQTAVVLDRTVTSTSSFAGTLERTPPAVRQTAATIANLRENLVSLEGQLSAISILGSQPLASAAAAFGEMATDLEGLDTRLEAIAADLDDNRVALMGNSGTLDALVTRLEIVADGLRDGVVEDSLADVQSILTVLFLLLLVWTALPAVAALALGWWIRRELHDPDGDGVIAA
ncbi:MAG: hypothetical protein ACSLFN_04010 [Candidatus Limnocylindrales bacterium]